MSRRKKKRRRKKKKEENREEKHVFDEYVSLKGNRVENESRISFSYN